MAVPPSAQIVVCGWKSCYCRFLDVYEMNTHVQDKHMQYYIEKRVITEVPQQVGPIDLKPEPILHVPLVDLSIDPILAEPTTNEGYISSYMKPEEPQQGLDVAEPSSSFLFPRLANMKQEVDDDIDFFNFAVDQKSQEQRENPIDELEPADGDLQIVEAEGSGNPERSPSVIDIADISLNDSLEVCSTGKVEQDRGIDDEDDIQVLKVDSSADLLEHPPGEHSRKAEKRENPLENDSDDDVIFEEYVEIRPTSGRVEQHPHTVPEEEQQDIKTEDTLDPIPEEHILQEGQAEAGGVPDVPQERILNDNVPPPEPVLEIPGAVVEPIAPQRQVEPSGEVPIVKVVVRTRHRKQSLDAYWKKRHAENEAKKLLKEAAAQQAASSSSSAVSIPPQPPIPPKATEKTISCSESKSTQWKEHAYARKSMKSASDSDHSYASRHFPPENKKYSVAKKKKRAENKKKAVKIYKCLKGCGESFTFPNRTMLEDHYLKDHIPDIRKRGRPKRQRIEGSDGLVQVYKCSKGCEIVFESRKTLEEHLKSEHDYVVKKSKPKSVNREGNFVPMFVCLNGCTKTFTSQKMLNNHYKKKHRHEMDLSSSDDDFPQKKPRLRLQMNRHCFTTLAKDYIACNWPGCGFTETTSTAVVDHYRESHEMARQNNCE